VSLAGPAFVNISLTDAAHLNGLTDDAWLGVARKSTGTVILDYGGSQGGWITRDSPDRRSGLTLPSD
jgi:hypothetical protein